MDKCPSVEDACMHVVRYCGDGAPALPPARRVRCSTPYPNHPNYGGEVALEACSCCDSGSLARVTPPSVPFAPFSFVSF